MGNIEQGFSWCGQKVAVVGLGFEVCLTSSSLMATQLFLGKPWSMGTRNWRQPDQWPTSSIMQIRLKIRMNMDAMFRN